MQKGCDVCDVVQYTFIQNTGHLEHSSESRTFQRIR